MQFIIDKLEFLETDNLLEKSLLLEREYFLRDHNLQYTDKMSMATGVEVRVPFLDTNLVKFVQSIPSTLKMTLLGASLRAAPSSSERPSARSTAETTDFARTNNS